MALLEEVVTGPRGGTLPGDSDAHLTSSNQTELQSFSCYELTDGHGRYLGTPSVAVATSENRQKEIKPYR